MKTEPFIQIRVIYRYTYISEAEYDCVYSSHKCQGFRIGKILANIARFIFLLVLIKNKKYFLFIFYN